MSLPLRGGVIWLAMLAMAIANGAVREVWITPRWGDTAGHFASTIILALLIAALGWAFADWLDVVEPRHAWLLGCSWAGLTLAFEFIGGRFLFGAPWVVLLADYNVFQGRIWLLGPVTTLLTPRVVYRVRQGR